MRCPACKADNPVETQQCKTCGAKLKTRTRRREKSEDSEVNSPGVNDVRKGPAWFAYRCGLVSLIPLAGLIFGPLALILGLRALSLDKIAPSSTNRTVAIAAIILGTVAIISQGIGLTLMVVGLRFALVVGHWSLVISH